VLLLRFVGVGGENQSTGEQFDSFCGDVVVCVLVVVLVVVVLYCGVVIHSLDACK